MPPKKTLEPLDMDALLSEFPVAPASGKAVISKSQPMPAQVQVNAVAPKQVEADAPVSDAPKRKFGIYARRVDKFSIKRIRVLMTPAVCPKCRLDLVALNNLEPWDELPSGVQQELIAGVAEHVQKVHDLSEQDIVDEDQIPTRYLGPKFEKQQMRTQAR